MEKGEKVKSKSKAKAPPPPSDISNSDLSDSSSDEEIYQITKNLDGKTRLFITKLMEDLESVQAELESREETLTQQNDLYIASKEALALERSEIESLRKALAKEQGYHAITKKENISLKKKYCYLDEKHKELELQYNVLWKSNSHPSKAKDTSTPSTSQGHGKCYNLNLNDYSTNLTNMKAMRKEIARLNEIIGKGCLCGKAQVSDKKANDSKGPQFKQGKHPSIMHGLGHTT
jgi:chromosome segregation ATPase